MAYTETELKMMEKLGLTPQDFEPKPVSTDEQLKMQEDAILELAEIISEVIG